MSDPEDTSGTALLAAILVTVAGMFYRPAILVYGWTHFVIPLGAPSVGYWQMFGLSILASVLISPYPPPDDGFVRRTCIRVLALGLCHLILWVLA